MTYYTGTGFSGATGVLTQARTTIPTHAAWSFVESTTMNAGAVPCDVYKCSKDESGLSSDFYIALMTSGSRFHFGIAEGYNTSTHLPKRPAMNATANLQPLQADGGVLAVDTELDWFNGSVDPGGGSISVAAAGLSTVSWSASPFNLSICIAHDAVAVIIDQGTTASTLFYAGAYITELGSDDTLPIHLSFRQNTGSTTLVSASFSTRHPRMGGQSTGWACNLNGSSGSNGTTGGVLSSAGSSFNPLAAPGSISGDALDIYHQTDVGAGKLAVLNSYTSGSATVGRGVNGWRRGWAKYLRYTKTNGFHAGDTVAIDGTVYVLGTGDTDGFWMERDPA